MPECVVCRRDRRHDVRRATHIEAGTQWLVCAEHRIDPEQDGAYMPLVGRVLQDATENTVKRGEEEGIRGNH